MVLDVARPVERYLLQGPLEVGPRQESVGAVRYHASATNLIRAGSLSLLTKSLTGERLDACPDRRDVALHAAILHRQPPWRLSTVPERLIHG
jgi:hypothetical protein